MSVLIKSEEMPQNCGNCPYFDNIACQITGDRMEYCGTTCDSTRQSDKEANERPKDCPLLGF